MLRKSFLQQQIDGLALALQKLLGLESADRAALLGEIKASCRDLTGLDIETLLALGDDSLVAMFSVGDRTRCAGNAFVAAGFLTERARVDPAMARRAHRKALLLYARAFAFERALHVPPHPDRLAAASQAVPDEDRTPLLRRLLVDAYEAMGRFSDAEDELYAMQDRGIAEAVPLARDFYGRLLLRPDDEIEAGGLTRAEIGEALADLGHDS